MGSTISTMEQELKEWLRNVQNQFFNSPKMENLLENGNQLMMFKGISIIIKAISHPVVMEK